MNEADIHDGGHTEETACLNCGTPLEGRAYCGACGQRAHLHRTLAGFGHDLVHGVLHFEGKLWNTLPAIFLRPGRMTREYIAGARARFISPIALYLFVVFVTFAILSALGENMVEFDDLEAQQTVAVQLERQQTALDSMRERRRDLTETTDGPRLAELVEEMWQRRDVVIDDTNRERFRLRAIGALDQAIEGQARDVETLRMMDERGIERASFENSNLLQFTSDGTFQHEGHGEDEMNALDRAWTDAKRNPSLLAYKLQNTAYKFGWLLIPISAPLVALLFLFGSRRYPLYDHAVFVTYSISVSLMFFLAMAIIGGSGIEVLPALPFLLMLVHIAVHFWRAYPQRKRGYIIRLPLLYLICMVSGALFMLAVAGIGIL